METPPPEKKKMNPWLRVMVGICGVVAIFGGIAQMKKGVGELRGTGRDPKVTQLLTETEAAVNEGNKQTAEATPLFQKLLNDCDSKGLAAVRQDSETAKKVDGLLGQSVEQFRLASKKSEEASQHEKNEKWKAFLGSKARSYELTAQTRGINQEIVHLVMDESITKMEDVVAKVQEAGQRRDAIQKNVAEADAAAEASAKQAKEANK